MSAASLRERWRTLVQRHGSARVAALLVGHRLLQRASGGRAGIVPYLLVAQPIGAASRVAMRGDPNTVVKRIMATDPVIAAFPRPAAVVAERFAAGHECHVAIVKGAFAGHIWIARGGHAEDEVRCRYEIADPAAAVWDHDVYVVPKLRLGRTLARLWHSVDGALAAEGVRWTFSRINRFSAASLKSHRRLGAVVVDRVVFVVVGRLQLALGGRGVGVHLQLADGGGPRFVLREPSPSAAR